MASKGQLPRMVIEIEGVQRRPACVAELIALYYR
jgi:hypothetical protein